MPKLSTITASPGAPAWVTTEPGQLVITPPIGIAVGQYDWTSTVADPGGLTTSVPVTVNRAQPLPTAAADDGRRHIWRIGVVPDRRQRHRQSTRQAEAVHS